MSQPLKSFEGPDVKALLARIRREVGPEAEISGAEKMRIGGVLGFFAKEQYRVLVKVPEVSGVIRPVESGPRRQSAHARAGRRSRRGEARAGAREPDSVVFRDTDVTAPVPVVGAPRRDVFEILADATDDVNDVVNSDTTASGAGRPEAGPVVAAGLTGAGLSGAEIGGAIEDEESFEAVLSRISTTLDSPLPTPPAPVSGVAAAPAVADATPVVAPTTPAVISRGRGCVPYEDDWAGPRGAGPQPQFTVKGSPDPGTIHVGDLLGTSLASEASRFLSETATGHRPSPLESLRRAGMDDVLLRSASEVLASGGDVQGVLLEIFGRLPSAPALPRRPGSLLVVVGPGDRARALADALSTEVGADPAEVALATMDFEAVRGGARGPVIRTSEEAAELAPGWRRSGVAVVAVDAPLTADHRSWAAHVISALRPTAVWGVVDATVKAEDLRAWAEDLGGVDGLAIENLDATVSPIAALKAGIPVVRLDGRPASASRWTATVVDRIDRCT